MRWTEVALRGSHSHRTSNPSQPSARIQRCTRRNPCTTKAHPDDHFPQPPTPPRDPLSAAGRSRPAPAAPRAADRSPGTSSSSSLDSSAWRSRSAAPPQTLPAHDSGSTVGGSLAPDGREAAPASGRISSRHARGRRRALNSGGGDASKGRVLLDRQSHAARNPQRGWRRSYSPARRPSMEGRFGSIHDRLSCWFRPRDSIRPFRAVCSKQNKRGAVA